MVKRGVEFKRRDHNFNIDANMALRMQYHGSRGLPRKKKKSGLWFGKDAAE